MSSPYKDLRQQFFSKHFELALNFEQFLKAGAAEQAQRWQSYQERLKLQPQTQNQLLSFTRQMNVLVLAGLWCGDCARSGAMLQTLAAATPKICLRFADNHLYPELQDELRIMGAQRVPVVVVLSEDFFEVCRYGDRALSVYRRKAATEVGTACDAGIISAPADELLEEHTEWLELLERAQLMLRLAPMLRRRYND